MSFINSIQMAFLPETILITAILLCIILSFITGKIKTNSIFYVSLAGLVLALFSYRFVPFDNEISLLNGSFVSNPYTCLFGILILIGAIIAILMSKGYTKSFEKSEGEFYYTLS